MEEKDNDLELITLKEGTKDDLEKKSSEDIDIELFCVDSSEFHETQQSIKRSLLDEQINQLNSAILTQKADKLDLSNFQDKYNFQDRIDTIIGQLKEISRFIKIKCAMIEKMNILMCIYTFKIYNLQHEFNKKLNALKEEREKIMLGKDDEDMVPAELLNLDRIIRELYINHEHISKGYKQQKLDTQVDYGKACITLDKLLDIMKRNWKLLSEEHHKYLQDTRKSEPLLIDYIIQAALEEYTIIIEDFDAKKEQGWKCLYGDEQMLDILRSRGLAITKSGNILTEEGDKFTYEEAEKMNLLEGLDLKNKIFPPVKDNEDFMPSASSFHGSEESERESLSSQISTEDIQYLKKALGKPLTLAISEIIARQPRDPIHYLGHWLFKYRYNQELDIIQKQEVEALLNERNRLLKERLHQLYEDEARQIIFEMINNAENAAIRKELERILREQMTGEYEDEDQAYREHTELKKLLTMLQNTP